MAERHLLESLREALADTDARLAIAEDNLATSWVAGHDSHTRRLSNAANPWGGGAALVPPESATEAVLLWQDACLRLCSTRGVLRRRIAAEERFERLMAAASRLGIPATTTGDVAGIEAGINALETLLDEDSKNSRPVSLTVHARLLLLRDLRNVAVEIEAEHD